MGAQQCECTSGPRTALKNALKDSKFYAMHILPQLKKWNLEICFKMLSIYYYTNACFWCCESMEHNLKCKI